MNKYSLNCALKKNITDELLLKYSEVYNLEINDYSVLKYIVINHLENGRKILDYAIEMKNTFNIEQYEIYAKFRKNNYKDASSKIYFQSKYGDALGQIKFKEKIKKTGLSKDDFIEKYGIEKAEEICKNKGNTLENFIKSHGIEEGPIKYKNWCKSNEGNLTLERQIEIHGEVEGTKRYNDIRYKMLNKNTLEYYIEIFGEVEGLNKYNDRNTKNSKSSRLNSIWKRNTPAYNTYREKMEELGLWLPETDEYKKFYSDVWSITKSQDLTVLDFFELRNHQNVVGSYSLDHKISIKRGYLYGYSAEELGHISNLQMLPTSLNSSKRDKCFSVIEYNNHLRNKGDIICI